MSSIDSDVVNGVGTAEEAVLACGGSGDGAAATAREVQIIAPREAATRPARDIQ
jgi:hypothetical protein